MAKESASKILSIDGQDVQITNPEKLYFSSQIKVTKLELVQYYLSVAPGALAGIQDRPIVLKRFVNADFGTLRFVSIPISTRFETSKTPR